jgi:hypothetical protein
MMLWTLPYSLVLNGVLFAGVNRLVLRHQEKGFAHLGFGMPERGRRPSGCWSIWCSWACSARVLAWRNS